MVLATSQGRVLVIDDHVGSRVATCSSLELHGYTCAHAGTASDAFAAIASFHPSIVLLEWSMRGGWGVGLARQLRERAAADQLCLIVIAVSTQEEPDAFCVDEGVDAYLVKPIAAPELARTVSRLAL